MKKIITVDFDDTLAVTEGGAWSSTNLVPVPRVIDFVKEKHKEGQEIHIVTFRNWQNKKEVESFCKVYKLPIKSIVCTEGTNKIPFLKQLKSNLHVDDSVEVCTLCIMAGIEVLLVDWGQGENNTTAKFLPKI
jgi:uncharacterized HAD superfamily protein